MPYIKPVYYEEQNLASNIVDLAVTNGWEKVKTFRKASYKFSSIFYGTGSFQDPDNVTFPVIIAEHIIFKNSVNQLFGLARVCDMTLKYKDLPSQFKLNSIPDQIGLNADSAIRQELHDWFHSLWNVNYLDTSKLFIYMLNEIPDVEDGGEITFPSNAGEVRAVLDIELQDYEPYKEKLGTGYNYEITSNQETMMQSPMIPMVLRETDSDNNGWLTNWWPDSTVKVEGYIDSEVIALMVRADSAPAPFDNQVPLTPLYLGAVIPLTTADKNTAAMFAGAASSSPTFAYNSDSPFIPDNNILMPINKSYPQHPGNGIDNIIVRRGLQGAYYQGYSFKVFAGPELMPPDRKDNANHQFVSAWKNAANDEYTYPAKSSYDDTAAITKAHITHPDERDRGYLKKLVIAPSVGIRNGTKLKVKKQACPDVFEYYKYFVSDAVSPITKRPGVVYRPMGIGIYEKETE